MHLTALTILKFDSSLAASTAPPPLKLVVGAGCGHRPAIDLRPSVPSSWHSAVLPPHLPRPPAGPRPPYRPRHRCLAHRGALLWEAPGLRLVVGTRGHSATVVVVCTRSTSGGASQRARGRCHRPMPASPRSRGAKDAVPLTRKQSVIAGGILKAVFKPQNGKNQMAAEQVRRR